jgi:hypothetical protein
MDEQRIDCLIKRGASTTRRTVLASLLVGLPAVLGLDNTEARRVRSAAQGVTVGTFPVSFAIENPCTGEEVTAEGVGHFVGGDHFRYELSGVGSSGATYQIRSVDNEGSAPSPRTSVDTVAATFRLVREGGSGKDDFISHAVVHLTVNANGVLTADFGVVRSRCI